jgi:hypothetical protein
MTRRFLTLSRTGEYFDPAELRKLTGLDSCDWPVGVVKELTDNALDAAETAGAQEPRARLEVGPSGVAVSDNGNGLEGEVLDRVIDFASKTSDKVRHKTPTRGAQGNALKTVLGIAYNAAEGQPVVVEALGKRHLLTPSVAGAGNAVVEHDEEPCGCTEGTRVFVPLQDTRGLLPVFARFSVFNPHARFTYSDGETQGQWGPHAPGYTKPKPTDKACPHWYGAGDFSQLVGAYTVNHPTMPLREFAGLFRGGAGKGAAIRQAVGGIRTIGELNGNVEGLRQALRDSVKAARPAALGPLGPHLLTGIRSLWPVVDGTEQYKHVEGLFDHDGTEIPFALDFVFAVLEGDGAGVQCYGVNNSPCYENPFGGVHRFRKAIAREEWEAWGFVAFLSEFKVNLRERELVAVHLNCPNLSFLDYGKTKLDAGPFVEALVEGVYAICLPSYRAKRKHERDEKRQQRIVEELTRQYCGAEPEKWTVKEAVLAVIPEAAEKASEGGTVVFPQRNLFYVARDLLRGYDVNWEATKNARLEWGTFVQIIKEHEDEHGEIPLMYQDPRGTFVEPHGGERIAVGTREVEAYRRGGIFNKVLYIEKEGFNPKLEQVRLAERYDMAVLSGKGFSTRAAQRLLAKLSGSGCKLAIAHDCDLAGYEIARTLREAARGCAKELEIIDLGLTWEEAMARGLEPEEYPLKRQPSEAFVRMALRGGMTAEAFRWLTGRDLHNRWGWQSRKIVTAQRFELNAFLLPDFVAWLESKLKEHRLTEKVVPRSEVLKAEAEACAGGAALDLVEDVLRELVDWESAVETVKRELVRGVRLVGAAEVRKALRGNPPCSWQSVLGAKQRSAFLSKTDRNAVKKRVWELLVAGAQARQTADDAAGALRGAAEAP